MYYKKIESDTAAKQAHDTRQKANAADRMKEVAKRKKAKRG